MLTLGLKIHYVGEEARGCAGGVSKEQMGCGRGGSQRGRPAFSCSATEPYRLICLSNQIIQMGKPRSKKIWLIRVRAKARGFHKEGMRNTCQFRLRVAYFYRAFLHRRRGNALLRVTQLGTTQFPATALSSLHGSDPSRTQDA